MVHFDSSGSAEAPRAADLLPFLVLTPLVATATFRWGLATSWPVLTLAWTSALTTGILGLPILVWLIERGRTGFQSVTITMAVAGVLPLVAALLSAMAGHAARGGLDYLGWVLDHGAPIPGYGLLPWPAFVRLELLSMLVGGIAGALYVVTRRNIVLTTWRRVP